MLKFQCEFFEIIESNFHTSTHTNEVIIYFFLGALFLAGFLAGFLVAFLVAFFFGAFGLVAFFLVAGWRTRTHCEIAIVLFTSS